MSPPACFPQMYSRDYYCRVPQRKAAGLLLHHSISILDASVLGEVQHLRLPGRRAGITEWQGLEQGYHVSLGWDWMELQDGDIRPVMVIPPRTNIRLIDPKGYDISEASAAPFLWDLIARLPWQASVAGAIREEMPLPRLA